MDDHGSEDFGINEHGNDRPKDSPNDRGRPMNGTASERLFEPARRLGGDRKPVRLIASIRERSATAHDAVISDLSCTGCQVSNIFLRADRPVWVRFGSLAPIEGRVIWARSDLAGIRFNQPLHEAVLDHIAGRARHDQH